MYRKVSLVFFQTNKPTDSLLKTVSSCQKEITTHYYIFEKENLAT